MENFSDPQTHLEFKYNNKNYLYRPFNSSVYKDNILLFSISSDLANWINKLTESSAKRLVIELIKIYNSGSLRAKDELKEKVARL